MTAEIAFCLGALLALPGEQPDNKTWWVSKFFNCSDLGWRLYLYCEERPSRRERDSAFWLRLSDVGRLSQALRRLDGLRGSRSGRGDADRSSQPRFHTYRTVKKQPWLPFLSRGALSSSVSHDVMIESLERL